MEVRETFGQILMPSIFHNSYIHTYVQKVPKYIYETNFILQSLYIIYSFNKCSMMIDDVQLIMIIVAAVSFHLRRSRGFHGKNVRVILVRDDELT